MNFFDKCLSNSYSITTINNTCANTLLEFKHNCDCGCLLNKICIDIFGIDEIIFNLDFIIYFYHADVIYNELETEFKQININIPYKNVSYENFIYYTNSNNIDIMKIYQTEYYFKNNQYYKSINNIETIDDNQTYIGLNDFLFSELKIYKLLNGCANIINDLSKMYNKHIKFIDNKLIFRNCKLILKIMDISFFYDIVNNNVKLKELWKVFYDKKSLEIIMINIVSIQNNFKLLKKICKT
jgi:hypothetical protein